TQIDGVEHGRVPSFFCDRVLKGSDDPNVADSNPSATGGRPPQISRPAGCSAEPVFESRAAFHFQFAPAIRWRDDEPSNSDRSAASNQHEI
ncbi:MAG: hypothetical protein R3338_14865, partial [Thermoanaerobaculia bacterium]|nr:hypothetical protein [Thermoanaerobaculia bacterium]